MDVMHPRCAGLDAPKKTVVARVRCVGGTGAAVSRTRSFAATTAALAELAAWLAQAGVTHVAIEATGVYWKPVWHALEGRFELTLANAQHLKRVPGRKTDIKDAERIATWPTGSRRCWRTPRSSSPRSSPTCSARPAGRS